MSEADEQKALVQWCDMRHIPIFHIPNGGRRDAREAAHLKAQGVRPGVPDLMVPVARGRYHGLFIELKYGKNKLSQKQFEWLLDLEREGYCAKCCYGWKDASELIKRYLELENGER